MNKSIRMGAAGAALAAALAFAGAAQAADNATATATAEVVKPLTLVKDVDLDFGKLVVAGAGTVDVATDGTATCSANITCYSTTTAAAFTVTEGTIGKEVKFSLPSGSIDLVRIGAIDPGTGFAASDVIVLDTLVTDATQNTIFDTDGITVLGYYYTVNLVDDGSGTNGTESFAIGGTANLDGSEVEGVYENTTDLSITVEYS